MAPLAFARSYSSRINVQAPSPITSPSRFASYGEGVVFGASLAAGISSLAGDVAGAINSYILNSKFVFDGRNRHTGYKFIAAFFIYAILSALLVMLLNQMGVTEEYCKVIVTPIMIIENYFINKFWVFKNDKR